MVRVLEASDERVSTGVGGWGQRETIESTEILVRELGCNLGKLR
jgi:hypothetical protein